MVDMPDTEPRMMLVSPPIGARTDFLSALEAALNASPFAATILRAEPGTDERALLKALKPLVEAGQAVGTAMLVEGAPDLVGRSGADGIHALGEIKAREAASRFKPEKIFGAGGLRTRDAAMAAGELGADYVLFGDPGKGGETPPLGSVIERLEWWAEIFTTPCVGQAETLDAVGPIAATGADFVALGAFVWTDANGPAAAVAAAKAALENEVPA